MTEHPPVPDVDASIQQAATFATVQEARHRRRWPWFVLATVLSLADAAAIWFVWFPHYRPALRDGERYGVDVSHHQGEIDWERVAGDDMSFAYIKATEGEDHVDRRFLENWEGARTAGLERGAYHFFTPCTQVGRRPSTSSRLSLTTRTRCRPQWTWSSPTTALLVHPRQPSVAS